MIQTARCKFTVTSAAPSYPDAPAGQQDVMLETRYDPELSKEDNAFSNATPSGQMRFVVSNPNLAGFFEAGKAYYIDITPVE